MNINLTSTLAQSGVFAPMPQAQAPSASAPVAADSGCGGNYLIYNPGVIERYRGSYALEETEPKAVTFLTESTKVPLIEQAALDVYGQVCVDLAKDLATAENHLRLGPLRGAARPCLLMNVMAFGSGSFTFFNYKAGCQPENADRVKQDLYSLLAAADPNEEVYKIQIVDTAVRGDGINTLRRYLWELKQQHARFHKQKWELDLRIIHANDEHTNVGNIERVKAHPEPGIFEVQLRRYVVPDLVVEDYEAALGMEITSDHGKFLVKQSYKPGQFLLKSAEGTRLVRSEALVVTFDELFSQSITDEMIYSQDLAQVGVVWNDYEQKG